MANKLNYNDFYNFPQSPPTLNEQCIAVCKICSREYKYSLNTKANLNHHISNSHPGELKIYFELKHQILPTLVTNESSILDFASFHQQDMETKELKPRRSYTKRARSGPRARAQLDLEPQLNDAIDVKIGGGEFEGDAGGMDCAPVEDEILPPPQAAADPLVEERRALLRAQCEYWTVRAHQTRLECLALERRLGLTPSGHTAALASSFGLVSANGSGIGGESNETTDSEQLMNGTSVIAVNGNAHVVSQVPYSFATSP